MLLIALVFFFLLGGVVALELFRKRRRVGARLDREWETIRDLAAERGLSEEQVELIKGLIERHAPRNALKLVTLRQHFDGCVEAEMALYSKDRDRGPFAKMGQELRDIRLRLGLDFVPVGQKISSTRDLIPGQSIWLGPVSDRSANWVRSVVGVVDEAYFEVAVADRKAASVLKLPMGENARFRLLRDGDGHYRFECEVVRPETAPPGWVFLHTSALKREQMREYFRVSFNHRVRIGVLDGSLSGDLSDIHNREAVTTLSGRFLNLSAGGCALLIEQPVPKQVLLRIQLKLPEIGVLPVEASIVSNEPAARGQFLVRAEFVELDGETQDFIERYVMQRQQPVDDSGKMGN